MLREAWRTIDSYTISKTGLSIKAALVGKKTDRDCGEEQKKQKKNAFKGRGLPYQYLEGVFKSIIRSILSLRIQTKRRVLAAIGDEKSS